MHLLLHIGPPKTATTSLQAALFRNRERLHRQGIGYYLAGKPNEWALPALYGNAKARLPLVLTERFADRAALIAWSAAEWERFEAWVDANRPEALILSSEHFAGVTDKAALIDRLGRRASRITLLAVARDPVAVFVSETDQAVRMGLGFADLVTPAAYRYRMDSVRAFEGLVDAGALRIVSFHAAAGGGGVVAGICAEMERALGQSLDLDLALPAVNESLCAAATVWLMSVNAVGQMGQGARKALIAALREDSRLKALPKLKLAEGPIAAAIRSINARTIGWVNRQLPPGDALALAPEGFVPPGRAELHEAMRAWLLDQAEPVAMRAVMEAISRLPTSG